MKIRYNVCYKINGHKIGIQGANIKKEKKSTCKPHYIPKKL